MSLEGNICFLIIYYHYKTNAIFALPISGFSNDIMFAASQQQYNLSKLKGYKICLNVINNQATKVIKKLDEEQCDLLLVEPHDHRANATESAIQTFKVHFISALATTHSKFTLQLWDRLTPQVESTLNMMHSLCVSPNISVYKAVHGPFDWNRFPLAPPGCKSVKHEVCWEAEASMHGVLVHLWTTTTATIFSSQRCVHTRYLASPNFPPSIARCRL
jgi:hypothetical protein